MEDTIKKLDYNGMIIKIRTAYPNLLFIGIRIQRVRLLLVDETYCSYRKVSVSHLVE